MTTFAHRAERVQPSAIREFLALAGDPAITSFAGGYPDPTLFPMDELHGIYADLLSPQHAAALQYTASDGLPELRALVAARLTADGMPCTADDVLITQGGQQGLDLTAKLFVDAGDVIVTERPTFSGPSSRSTPASPSTARFPWTTRAWTPTPSRWCCAAPSGSSSSTPFPTTRTPRVAR
jgi:2-aminoadipate transaminase